MIGARATLSATAAVLGLGILASPGGSDPALPVAASAMVRQRADAALAALDELRAAMQPGLDAGRAAAAAVLSGERRPGPALERAGGLVAEAEARIPESRRTVAALTAALLARDPGASPIEPPLAAGELESIGTQLAAASPPADDFAEIRRDSLAIPAVLGEAIMALERGATDEAAALVAEARAAHAAVAAWDAELSTLPVWLDTTDAMISGVERIVDAVRRGDADAARQAAADFAALEAGAATGDRALRIALSEGGSALTSIPLGRLADALRAIDASRARIASVVDGLEAPSR